MKKQIITAAIAASIAAGTVPNAYADDTTSEENRHREYIGTGIGAVAGGVAWSLLDTGALSAADGADAP